MNKISIRAPKFVRQMTKMRFVTNEKCMQRESIQIPHTYITSCCIDTSFDHLKPPFKAIDMDNPFCFFTNVGLQKALETLTSDCYYWLPHNKQLMVGSHGVSSPNMEAKSQLLSLKKTFKYGQLSLKSDLDSFMHKYSWDLCWELGLAFCSTQLSTQVPSLISKKCCHMGIYVILGT